GRWTPARSLTQVLLPAPFSPSSASTSPARSSSETSCRARVPPNDLLAPRRPATASLPSRPPGRAAASPSTTLAIRRAYPVRGREPREPRLLTPHDRRPG